VYAVVLVHVPSVVKSAEPIVAVPLRVGPPPVGGLGRITVVKGVLTAFAPPAFEALTTTRRYVPMSLEARRYVGPVQPVGVQLVPREVQDCH
jgi:hypothetical protein